MFDKEAERQVLTPGDVGNQLQVFEDRPLCWDAWDIDSFFEDRPELIRGVERIELVESGPLRATVLVERRYRDSHLVQRISLVEGSKRVDFVTEVDWRETHALLKAAFPVNILTPVATFEIQWGSIERPTHRNTSWDQARFEVAAQKWVDLSEGDYGVALLNDCKYGHDVSDNVIRISLIKSATMPNTKADQGPHMFTYCLLPHTGDWRDGVPAEAYALNRPLRLQRTSGPIGAETRLSLVWSEHRNAVIETVKPAEDGNGFIIRLYEAERKRGPVRLRFGVPITKVALCDLLENAEADLCISEHGVELELRPFEIVTLRCEIM